MTPLAQMLVQRIRAGGPITLAEYMGECLLHPTHGYYATRDPFGQAGDFTTAPEISQMFGEMIGLWLAQVWLDQGATAPFALVELGPGRGTLMADILRATRGVAGFHDALSVHLVEASPTLRAVQTKTIARPVTHHDTCASLPDLPLFLVANEFFDALPIRQFSRNGGHWSERMVGLDAGKLSLGRGAPSPQPALAHRTDLAEGDIVELCPALPGILQDLATPIARNGGAALVIDYGDWRSRGDTVQALRAHQSEDILASPGEADLTAHVDFEAIARAATPLRASPMTPQGVFLERLGITARAQALAAALEGEALRSHIAAHRRLTHPEEMGNLFKTIALLPEGAPVPPGFAQ